MGSRRWWALAALALWLLAVSLDTTVLNAVLPRLSTALNASTSQLQWFTDSYNLVLAAGLLPAGLLGDRYGRKRTIVAGLGIFGAGSLGSAYAHSPVQLIVARGVLGAGAAILIPLSVAVLLIMFAPAERPRAVAVITVGSLIGIPAGPIVGGLLLHAFWWGSVFLLNVPLAVIGLLAVVTLVPESRRPEAAPPDRLGLLLSAVGMAAITYGVIAAGDHGWTAPVALVPVLGGVAALGVFVAVERRVADPLVDLALFRGPGFAPAAALVTVVSFALFGVLFDTPQYLQSVDGYGTLGTGLRLLPLLGAMVVAVQVATRLTGRIGAKPLVLAGLILMTGALAAGATTTVDSGYPFVAGWLAALGSGLGLALPAATLAALGALPAARAGTGSATIYAIRQLGSTVGVAVLGTVTATAYRSHLPGTSEAVRASVAGGAATAARLRDAGLAAAVRHAFAAGLDATLWSCAGVSLAALAVAALLPGPQRRPSGAAGPHADRSLPLVLHRSAFGLRNERGRE